MPTERDFADIYEEYYRRVLLLCRYSLQSSATAEDAAQEVFLRAQFKRTSYDPALPMSSWFFGIASHHCIDILRRQNIEKRLFDSGAKDSFDAGSPAPGPLSQLLSNERGRELRHALETLTDKYRVPLVLAYYCEFNYEEIGETLGVDRNTVGTLIFRGKRLLRQSFERESKRDLSN